MKSCYHSEYPYHHIKLVEGFDMVGKTTFMKYNFSEDAMIYHPTHDLTDKTVGRDKSWVIGYGIIDLLSQINQNSPEMFDSLNVLIDRGVFSSYVYSRIYSNEYLNPSILEFYRNSEFFKNSINHLYVKHHDVSTAEEIFELSKSRDKNPNALSNKYDTFNNFSDYWVLYNTADMLFKDAYDKVGIIPTVFETLPNKQWVERSGF